MIGGQMAFTISFIAGIACALPILFWSVNRYEGFFDDQQFFLTIMLALALGLVGAVLYLVVTYYYFIEPFESGQGSSVAVIVIFALFFALLEASLKAMYLNRPKYHKDYGVIFYGASFGAGYAAMVILAFTYYGLNNNDYFNMDSADMFVGTALFSAAWAFMHITLGTMMGAGVHKGDMMSTGLLMVILSTPFNALLFIWGATREWELMAVCLIGAVGLYRYYYTRSVMGAMPAKEARRLRRETLQKARKKRTG